MTDNKLLIVAWDGLDLELLKKYGNDKYFLDNGRVGGRIDNDFGIHTRSTSELFTTFITGENYEEHGVKGLNKYNTRGRILEKLMPKPKRYNDPVMAKIYNFLMKHSKADYRKYDKQDYELDTMFEEVEHSQAMFVPGYNPGHAWAADLKAHTLDELSYRDNPIKEAEKTIEMTYDYRKKQLMERLSPEKPEYVMPDLVMIQFHYVDSMQHLHAEPTLGVDHEKMQEIYCRVEQESKEIVEHVEEQGYEVMFMSDHGLPKQHHHNRQAMWSVTEQAYEDLYLVELDSELNWIMPKMKDFKEKIVEYVG